VADAFLLENGTDRFLLEDGSGLYLNEVQPATLVISDGHHAHNVYRSPPPPILEIQDAVHASNSDNVTLSAEQSLAVQDAVHAHTADNVNFGTPLVLAIGIGTGSGNTRSTVSVSPGPDRLIVFTASLVGSGTIAVPSVVGLDLEWRYETRGHENGEYPRQGWMWSAITDSSPSSGAIDVTFNQSATMRYAIVEFPANVELSDPILQPRGRFPDLPPDNGGQKLYANHEMAGFADPNNSVLHYILIGSVNTPEQVTDATGFTRLGLTSGSGWTTLLEWKDSEALLIDPEWSGAVAHYVSVAAEIRKPGVTGGRVRDRSLITDSSITDGTVYTTEAFTTYANRDVWFAVASARSAATPSQPTITDSAGLSWSLVDSVGYSTVASPTQKLWIFRARVGASEPGAITVTATYPETQTAAAWIAVETRFSHATSPVIQTKANSGDNTGAAGIGATFDAGVGDDNSVLFFMAKKDNDRVSGDNVLTGTPDSGYVPHEQSAANDTPAVAIASFGRHTPENSPSITLWQNADVGVIALEIAQESAEANLAIQDATHGHASDNVALTQVHALAVADASHGHLADTFALAQVHSLVVAEALHTHTADNLVLGVGGITLAIADGRSLHAADGLTLAQVHVLAISDGQHGQAADNIAFTQVHILAIQDGAHVHLADSLALAQVHVLAVADAVHAHRADNVLFLFWTPTSRRSTVGTLRRSTVGTARRG
jgi:hypothetical protein